MGVKLARLGFEPTITEFCSDASKNKKYEKICNTYNSVKKKIEHQICEGSHSKKILQLN